MRALVITRLAEREERRHQPSCPGTGLG